jgi:acyl carrier protein
MVIMEGISASIHEFLLREFLPGEDPRELTHQTPLITGGILNSISTLKLVTFLEDQFGITIEAHEAGVDHLDTIERVGALVAAKRKVA